MKHILCVLAVTLFVINGYCESATLEQQFIPFPPFLNVIHLHEIAKIKKIKKIYETWRKEGTVQDSYRIPKILHFIWLGSPLPKADQEMIASWRKFHPSWTIYVWTDEEAKTFPFLNRAAFDAAKNFAEKSDIWRYELLYRFGGIYSDTDVECTQPFDTLCKSCDFFAGLETIIERSLGNFIGNALIGSIPGHPLLFECLSSIRPGPGDNDSFRIIFTTSPGHFTYCFLALGEKYSPNITCLPPSYFYPFYLSDKKQHSCEWLKEHTVKKETMAVHYWGTRWVKKKK
jgi:inositol phosphorylceramide mannosyltransferase catalytic subunit